MQIIKSWIILLVSLTPLALADSASSNGRSYEAEILEIANKEAVAATKQFDAAEKRCKKKEKKLDVSLFKDLGIPFEELMNSLYYLSKKARAKCEGNTLQNYYFAVSRLEHILDHYGKKKYKQFGTVEVLHSDAWKDIELQVKYNETAPEHREVLESMPELTLPFDPLDQIGEIEKALSQ